MPWQPVIEKILTHLGQQADCGRRSAPARGPAPQEGLAPASASAACKAVHRLGRHKVGRRCKRPDPHSNFSFRRRRTPGPRGTASPGASWDRSKRPDDQGSPGADPMTDAFQRHLRRSAGRSELQRPHQAASDAVFGVPWGRKMAFEFPILKASLSPSSKGTQSSSKPRPAATVTAGWCGAESSRAR